MQVCTIMKTLHVSQPAPLLIHQVMIAMDFIVIFHVILNLSFILISAVSLHATFLRQVTMTQIFFNTVKVHVPILIYPIIMTLKLVNLHVYILIVKIYQLCIIVAVLKVLLLTKFCPQRKQ